MRLAKIVFKKTNHKGHIEKEDHDILSVNQSY